MKSFAKSVLAIILIASIVGCSTTGRFVVPNGADLYINNREQPVEVASDGTVSTRPYGWNSIGIPPEKGIPYKLEQNGRTIKEGRLRSVFRPVSIFWPPYAIIYWPVGLNPNITYDLVNDTQQ